MILKIDSDYIITSDENNFILSNVYLSGDKSKNPGEEKVKTIGYYGSLESALNGYVKISLRNLEGDLLNVINKLDELKESIKGIK